MYSQYIINMLYKGQVIGIILVSLYAIYMIYYKYTSVTNEWRAIKKASP